MPKIITVYLIDPNAATIKPVEIDACDSFKPVYELIGCELVQLIAFDSHHALLVDDDGLRDGLTAFTIFDGYPQPIAGKIVLMGGHDGALFKLPQISIEDAAKRFQCCAPVLDPIFAGADEITVQGVILAGALTGFQTRITRKIPTVMAGVVKWATI